MVLSISSAAGVTQPLEECPSTLELVSQTFGSGENSATTSLAGQANSTLVRDINFTCGDRIVIEIAASSTSVRAEASG
jgi:hypothetical protein